MGPRGPKSALRFAGAAPSSFPGSGRLAESRSLSRRFCQQAKRRDPRDGINNRISTNIGFAPNYDNDGDLLGDPVSTQQNVNAFDAEGRAVTLEGIGVTYDALGRAVEAAEPGGAIEFLYGPGGGKLAVMNGQTLLTADVPLPGGGSAVYHGAALAYYRHADWLGSSRLASTPSRTLYSATAYAPYGEHHEEAGTIDRNFTGQNQDIDSSHSGGQYDFLDREFNAIQGRWWTPDPAGLAAVDPNNPQSWNRYAYVGGRPLSATDPLGLTAFPGGRMPVASNDSGRGSDSNAEASGDFGPYEPDEDGAAAASGDDGYSGCASPVDMAVGGWGGTTLDGVDISSWLAGDLTTPTSTRAYSCYSINCDIESAQQDQQILAADVLTPPPYDAHACQEKVLGDVNRQFGTSFTDANVARAVVAPGGGEFNVTISATALSAAQFNAINTGRYASVFTMLTGVGDSLHLAGPSSLDPGAVFAKTNVGGATSVLFTAHLDSGYAYNPFGAFQHLITDVLGHGSRNPCP